MTDRDFPYYNGQPVALSGRQWLLVLLFCCVGFLVLIAAPTLLPGQAGRWAGALLFAGLPVLGLRLAAGPAWRALFPPLRARDLWIGLAFAPLNLLATTLTALLVIHTSVTTANPAIAQIGQMQGLDLALFFAVTLPQLLGEELVTILPFLAILTVCSRGLKTGRRTAIAAAWILSALLFGALHLPTYGWNLLQALGIIGIARLVLTAPFILTKSPWSSAVAHVTNDWLLFGTSAVLAVLKASPA
ncbi:CPBP family intramembrane glutamic endopeptidase [Brevundimonas sp.]|uniref:CPBP family intramembrane glutamic endopeptidase n=1 Tax=Brevundimonas sp. TaxID=1871086 RepID=UPI003D6D4F42